MGMLLDDYKAAALFDELVDEQGKVRPYYQGVADRLAGLSQEELSQKIRSLELLFLKQGITFTVYGDDRGTERVFPFDPFPRVVPASSSASPRSTSSCTTSTTSSASSRTASSRPRSSMAPPITGLNSWAFPCPKTPTSMSAGRT